jgi:hypothetical protein
VRCFPLWVVRVSAGFGGEHRVGSARSGPALDGSVRAGFGKEGAESRPAEWCTDPGERVVLR